MPLPESAPRRPLHHRAIHFNGFIREDGLWDVEGFLTDQKPYDFRNYREVLHSAGQPIHDFGVRVTLNDAQEVVDIHAVLDASPYASCGQSAEAIRNLIGCTIGPGWKETVRTKLPEQLACTHLSELLIALATVVFQTRGFGKTPEGTSPLKTLRESGVPPFFVGKCLSWRRDGDTVREVFPLLYRPR